MKLTIIQKSNIQNAGEQKQIECIKGNLIEFASVFGNTVFEVARVDESSCDVKTNNALCEVNDESINLLETKQEFQFEIEQDYSLALPLFDARVVFEIRVER